MGACNSRPDYSELETQLKRQAELLEQQSRKFDQILAARGIGVELQTHVAQSAIPIPGDVPPSTKTHAHAATSSKAASNDSGEPKKKSVVFTDIEEPSEPKTVELMTSPAQLTEFAEKHGIPSPASPSHADDLLHPPMRKSAFSLVRMAKQRVAKAKERRSSKQILALDNRTSYHLCYILYKDDHHSQETINVSRMIRKCLALRKSYLYSHPPLYEKEDWDGVKCSLVDGVYHLLSSTGKQLVEVPDVHQFYHDLNFLWGCASNGPFGTLASRRLQTLKEKCDVYRTLNLKLEEVSSKTDHQDIYLVNKIDNHIHLAAAMTAKHLLRFIITKVRTCPNDVVMHEDGKDVTLSQMFVNLGLDPDNIDIDSLSVCGGAEMFHRFDNFNSAYNPFGHSALRTVFMKTDNYQGGKYFAELTREIFDLLDLQDNNVSMEPRISIYGQNINEWTVLAKWVVSYRLFSKRVRWIVQIPRIYSLYRVKNSVPHFQQFLTNIFKPLFDATLDPDAHPELHVFLANVGALDSVDDESFPDLLMPSPIKAPQDWTESSNPPYSYYLYYFYANLRTLNLLRQRKGMNMLSLRPHCGESGPVHHLATAFLTSQSINHGIQLEKSWQLEYLYYITRMGMSISPLSNNVLFREVQRNPFGMMFIKGLNVTLSTDDPMQFHTTQEPLVEEYTIAKTLWRLTPADLCEIALNSVTQSSFSLPDKSAMLGPGHDMVGGLLGNDCERTGVPDCRISFRVHCLVDEYKFLWSSSLGKKYPHREPSVVDPAHESAEERENALEAQLGTSPFTKRLIRSAHAYADCPKEWRALAKADDEY